MKIGFDGKRAVQNCTGLGNYSRYIIDLLCRNFPDNEYIIYAPRKGFNCRLEEMLKHYPQLRMGFPHKSVWSRMKPLWRIWGMTQLLRQDNVAVFHGLSNELPLNIRRSKVRRVVTIHDLIFLRFPQYYRLIDRKIYAFKFFRACLNADKIIAISECTKRDIMYFFNIQADKIEVVYQGCDPSFAVVLSEEHKEQIKKKYQLPRRYILNVGRIEERKNVLLVVEALQTLPEDIHLVIVGYRTAYAGKVEHYAQEKGITGRIHIIENVPSSDLPAIYQAAELFVYPSRFEGFGIPIIEALHSCIPVVAATGSCLEEAGGPNSVYVHPDDPKSLSKVFMQILSDSGKRKQMVESGKKYVLKFSESCQAEALDNIYRELLLVK